MGKGRKYCSCIPLLWGKTGNTALVYRNDKCLDRQVWANSVDPDQTAPKGAVWSGSTLFAIVSASFERITLWQSHLVCLNFKDLYSIYGRCRWSTVINSLTLPLKKIYIYIPVMALTWKTFNVTSLIDPYLHVHHLRCPLCLSLNYVIWYVIVADWQENFRSAASRLAGDFWDSASRLARDTS